MELYTPRNSKNVTVSSENKSSGSSFLRLPIPIPYPPSRLPSFPPTLNTSNSTKLPRPIRSEALHIVYLLYNSSITLILSLAPSNTSSVLPELYPISLDLDHDEDARYSH